MVSILYKLFTSLFIYGLFFGVAYLGFSFAEDSIEKNNQKRELLGSFVGIVSLCILASIRALSVGTDVLVYVKPIFEQSKQTVLFQFLLNNPGNWFFCTLAYISSHLFGSINVFFFLIQLIVVFPVYLFARKNSNYISLKYAMAVFMLLYAPMSFNIMRQSMAASVLLLGSYYLREKKVFLSIALALIAFLLHASALIGVALFLLATPNTDTNKQIKRYFWLFLIAIGSGFVLSQWANILTWLIYQVRILPQSYSHYITIFTSNSLVGHKYYFEIGLYNYVDILFRLVFLLISLISLNKINTVRITNYYSNISIINFVMYIVCFLVFRTTYVYRISMYLDYCNVFNLSCNLSRKKHRRFVYSFKNIIVLGCAFTYFLIIYFYFGAHGVVPFKIGWS